MLFRLLISIIQMFAGIFTPCQLCRSVNCTVQLLMYLKYFVTMSFSDSLASNDGLNTVVTFNDIEYSIFGPLEGTVKMHNTIFYFWKSLNFIDTSLSTATPAVKYTHIVVVHKLVYTPIVCHTHKHNTYCTIYSFGSF